MVYHLAPTITCGQCVVELFVTHSTPIVEFVTQMTRIVSIQRALDIHHTEFVFLTVKQRSRSVRVTQRDDVISGITNTLKTGIKQSSETK